MLFNGMSAFSKKKKSIKMLPSEKLIKISLSVISNQIAQNRNENKILQRNLADKVLFCGPF